MVASLQEDHRGAGDAGALTVIFFPSPLTLPALRDGPLPLPRGEKVAVRRAHPAFPRWHREGPSAKRWEGEEAPARRGSCPTPLSTPSSSAAGLAARSRRSARRSSA